MAENMPERVARAMALFVERSTTLPGEEPPWSLLGFASAEAFVEENWRNYEGQARAAIEAMREPTEAQRAYARSAWDAYGEDGKVNLYRAMIAAALEETK